MSDSIHNQSPLRLDKDSILAAVRVLIPGARCSSTHYGKDLTFRFGYSRVLVNNHKNWDRIAHTRKEGQGDPFPILYPDEVYITGEDPQDQLVRVIADVLKNGRTIECGKGVGLSDLQYHMPDSGVDMDWSFLMPRLLGEKDERPWDLNPDYQRGAVWTPEQQSLFIGHVLRGGKAPPIFCQRYDKADNAPEGSEYWDLPVEVIDGQQRLRAVMAFMREGLPARMFIDTTNSWVEFVYDDLHEVDRRNRRLGSKITFVDLPRAERLRFYLRLNGGGTPHTQDELDRVRDLLEAET